MTRVGQILVFLNLVFSIVVGAFAVMTYTARTHWADKYEKLSKSFTVVEATAQTYKTEADRLTRERNEYNQKLYANVRLRTELGLKTFKPGDPEGEKEASRAAEKVIVFLRERSNELQKLKEQLAQVNQDLGKAKLEITGYQTTTRTAQEDVKRRQADVEKLREVLRAETARNDQLVRDMNEMRDRTYAAEINARSLRERNAGLEEQLQNMARDLARIGKSSGPGRMAGRVNPPPENVEGLIQRVEGNLVTVSIGSDAGLAKGQTLEVFRFGPNPRYLGRIRIVDVTPTQAVGQVVGRLTAPIQRNDTVGSSVMGRR